MTDGESDRVDWRRRGPVVAAAIAALAAAVGVLLVTGDPDVGADDPEWLPEALGPTFAAPPPTTAARPDPSTAVLGGGSSATTGGATTTIIDAPTITGGTPPTPSPPPSDAEAGGAWRGLEIADPELTGALEDIVSIRTASGEALVSVGTDGERPLVLVSRDGERWERMSQSGLEVEGAARAVAVDAERVVAVGRGADGPAVWELRGGGPWASRQIEGAADADVVLSAVAVLGDRTVVTGFDGEGSGLWLGVGDADVLTRVPLDDVDGAVAGETIVRDIVVADEELIAVGRAGEAPTRWTSSDGSRWRAVPLDDPDGGGTPIALSGDGAVVGGYDGVGGVVWRVDGRTQRRWRVPEPSDRPQTVDALAASGALVFLIGRDGQTPRCWTGPLVDLEDQPAVCEDAVSIPAGALLRGAAWRDDSIVAVGARRDSATRPGIWIRNVE